MTKVNNVSSIVMLGLLIVCTFSSDIWKYDSASAQAEILYPLSGYLIFGKINIYHLFSGLLLFLYFYIRFIRPQENKFCGEKNFLKSIFWLYFIPVNVLQYIASYLKNITIRNFGIYTIGYFLVFLIVVYYVQEIFLKNKQGEYLNTCILILEIFILFRAIYSIIKFASGIGPVNPIIGGIRIGKEPDFADFYCLLFIIALTRLLFRTDKEVSRIILHIAGIITSSFIAIASLRRNFIIEIIIASLIVLYLYYRKNKLNLSTIFVAAISFVAAFVLSIILFMGPSRFINNYYVGRLISSLSLVSNRYESEYGDLTGHKEEIEDGWNNVKQNWLLGVTNFGEDLVVRARTKDWQKGLMVHNAYLEIWLAYGLLGLILFLWLYLKSLELGYFVFFKLKREAGVILMAFIICQLVKNIVWPTAISLINVTIVYIFLISILLRLKQIEVFRQENSLS